MARISVQELRISVNNIIKINLGMMHKYPRMTQEIADAIILEFIENMEKHGEKR